MEFKNRLNEEVELKDGRIVWLSRACAIVGVIFAQVQDDIFVLTEQRSPLMDEPNKWCVISGYLDWDENGLDGIKRETYEESSFDIEKHEKQCIFDNKGQPFYVHTDPWSDAKQNVSLSYIFIYNFKKLPMYVEKYKDKEISQVKWMNIIDLKNNEKEWAFNHDARIKMALYDYCDKFI